MLLFTGLVSSFPFSMIYFLCEFSFKFSFKQHCVDFSFIVLWSFFCYFVTVNMSCEYLQMHSVDCEAINDPMDRANALQYRRISLWHNLHLFILQELHSDVKCTRYHVYVIHQTALPLTFGDLERHFSHCTLL